MGKPSSKEKVMKWVSMIYRCGQGRLAKQLGPLGIGKGQMCFLMRLSRADGLSQDELSSALFFDKSATARALAHLERNGLVERRPDHKDGRVNRVYITEKARRLKPALRKIRNEWNETLFEGFTKQEREIMVKGLRRMAENVSGITDLREDG